MLHFIQYKTTDVTPLSAVTDSLNYLSRCLISKIPYCKTPTTVNWSEPLQIFCLLLLCQKGQQKSNALLRFATCLCRQRSGQRWHASSQVPLH